MGVRNKSPTVVPHKNPARRSRRSNSPEWHLAGWSPLPPVEGEPRVLRKHTMERSAHVIHSFLNESPVPRGKFLSEAVDEISLSVHSRVHPHTQAHFMAPGPGDETEKEHEKPAPRRKLILMAGLHSHASNSKPQPFTFPLPVNRKLINKNSDFHLPWNIYGPSLDGERKVLKWRPLKKNAWYCQHFKVSKEDRPSCICKEACGEDCLNR